MFYTAAIRQSLIQLENADGQIGFEIQKAAFLSEDV